MLGHKVALSATLLAALQLLTKFIDVIMLVVMARLLTPADFGLVTLATSVLLIASAVTELPAVNALVQRDVVDPRDVDTAFTLNLLRGLTVALIICLCASPMAAFYQDPRLAVILYALSVVPLATSLASPAIVHFMHRIDYGPTARSMIYGKIVGVLSAIVVVLLTHSYWALVVSPIVSPFVAAAYTYYAAPYRPRMRLAGSVSILKFSGWLTASRIISTVNLQSDRFFIGHILGKGPLGQYTIGSDIASMVTYAFAGPIMQTMFGGFARLQGDAARMRAAYLKGQQTLVFVLLPLGFGLSSIADRLVPFLMGPNWDAAVMVISWLAPVVALQVLYMPLLSFSMAVGRPRLLVVREAVNLACRLPLTLAGAWWFGLAGAVIARTAGAFLVILLTLRIARQFMDISVFRQIVNIWRSLVSVAAMLAVVTALKWALAPRGDVFAQALELLLFVSMGGLAYVATHFLLWLVAGRPDGAETFVITMIRRTARREL